MDQLGHLQVNTKVHKILGRVIVPLSFTTRYEISFLHTSKKVKVSRDRLRWP
jgi:hypothetical protein